MRATLLGFLLALSLLAEDAKPLPQGASLDIYIVEVEGEVDVQFAPKEAWMPAVKGAKLAVGSKLMSGIGGKAVLAFGSNSVAQMGEATSFEIRSFGMQGDKLVANVLIDPGVAHVALKQLGAFKTDFQVSTPRLTCSVRGSKMRVAAQGDEITDEAECPEDEAFVNQGSGQERHIAEHEQTNSNNDSNQQITTTENLSDTTPTGTTEQEGADENLLSQNAGSIDLNVSDATVDTDPSPSGGDGGTLEEPPQEPPPNDCDPVQIAADNAFLLEHGLDDLVNFLQTGAPELQASAQDEFYGVNVNQTTAPIYVDKREAILYLIHCSQFGTQLEDLTGIVNPSENAYLHFVTDSEDVLSHVGKDGKPEGNPSFGGGFEGQPYQDALLYAKRNGFPAFVDVFAQHLLDRFNQDPTGLKSTPAGLDIFNAILADFHGDAAGLGTGYGYDQLVGPLGFLQQADDEAREEGVVYYTPLVEDILLAMFHKEFETAEVDPPASREAYLIEHDAFINGDFAELLASESEGFDHFLAHFGKLAFETWKNETIQNERPNPGAPGFDEIQHFRGDLLTLLSDVREMTGTTGYGTSQELGAAQTLADLGDLRHHLNTQDDRDDFRGIQPQSDFERSVVPLFGLRATVDVMVREDTLKSINESGASLSPGVFQARLDMFNGGAFGYDAHQVDWDAVATAASTGNLHLDPQLFGTALIEELRADKFKDFFGQTDAQFDVDRADLDAVVTELNTKLTAVGGGFDAFLRDPRTLLDPGGLETRIHDEYHAKYTDAPSLAHDAFHAALQQFDDDAHAAVAPPQ